MIQKQIYELVLVRNQTYVSERTVCFAFESNLIYKNLPLCNLKKGLIKCFSNIIRKNLSF